ncbi:hypothetical protein D3C71_985980 [compost metagenome]
MHRHAAAENQNEGGQIELAEILVVHQRVEKRVNAGENMRLIMRQLLHEAGNIARIGDQQVMAAERNAHQRIHRQCEDVAERQRADEVENLRAIFFAIEGRVQPQADLDLVGQKIGMGENRTLRYARCATGIL